MSVDLLVFGPHPDDLEIGLGGAIAAHTAAGRSVGLCDLTAGELGTNGTPEERREEALEAARVLGAAWRENLHWPDGGITPEPARLRQERRPVHVPPGALLGPHNNAGRRAYGRRYAPRPA